MLSELLGRRKPFPGLFSDMKGLIERSLADGTGWVRVRSWLRMHRCQAHQHSIQLRVETTREKTERGLVTDRGNSACSGNREKHDIYNSTINTVCHDRQVSTKSIALTSPSHMKYIILMASHITIGGHDIRSVSRNVLDSTPCLPPSSLPNHNQVSVRSHRRALDIPGASENTRSITVMSLAFAADTQSLGRDDSLRVPGGRRRDCGGPGEPMPRVLRFPVLSGFEAKYDPGSSPYSPLPIH